MSLENPKTAGFVTIRYVVMSILNRLKDYSMKDYRYLAQLVIEGFSDLNMYHLSNVEVVYLYMDEAKTVSVPADFIDWLKVGIPISGKLHVLTRKQNMLKPRVFPDGAAVGHTDEEDNAIGAYFTDHFRDGIYVSGLYGLTGGFNMGYYDYDREKRQFIFSGTIPRSEVVLEYISTGVKLTGSTVIPRQALDPLQRYVFWQRQVEDPRVPLSTKQYKEDLYDRAVQKLVNFESTPTMDEYKDALYRKIKQTVKR